MKGTKLKVWGALVAGSILVGGFAHAESPYAAEASQANQVVQAGTELPAATNVNACASELALRDTLYWAVFAYDRLNPGAEHQIPSRARMVQLRNQAKRDAEACLNGE